MTDQDSKPLPDLEIHVTHTEDKPHIIYTHKLLLSLGSPVFHSFVLEIPKLINDIKDNAKNKKRKTLNNELHTLGILTIDLKDTPVSLETFSAFIDSFQPHKRLHDMIKKTNFYEWLYLGHKYHVIPIVRGCIGHLSCWLDAWKDSKANRKTILQILEALFTLHYKREFCYLVHWLEKQQLYSKIRQHPDYALHTSSRMRDAILDITLNTKTEKVPLDKITLNTGYQVTDITNTIYLGKVIEIKENKALIRFLGILKKWDEWVDIPSPRIKYAKLKVDYTKVLKTNLAKKDVQDFITNHKIAYYEERFC